MCTQFRSEDFNLTVIIHVYTVQFAHQQQFSIQTD